MGSLPPTHMHGNCTACRRHPDQSIFLESLSLIGVLLAALLLPAPHLYAQSAAASNFSSLAQAAAADRDAGHADAALREYQQAVHMQPQWAEGWWNLGVLQYQASQYADALASFRTLTILHPEAGMAWSMLGLCAFETKDYTSALRDLQLGQNLGAQPDAETARVAAYHLALLQIRSGAFTQAQQTLQTSLGQAEYPDAAQVALGLALLRVPLLPSEVAPAQDALLHAAGAVAALLAQGNSTQALAQFPGLLSAYPKTPYLHLAYGKALAAAGHSRQALLQMRLEEAISPQSALPWRETAQIDLRRHQDATAIPAARRAVALDPNSSVAQQTLAQALQAGGETSAARKHSALAAALPAQAPQREPRLVQIYAAPAEIPAPDPTPQWNAAMQAYAQQQYATAEALLQPWLAQHPQDGTAWAVLGLSEAATGDDANALLHLQQGQQLGLRGSQQAQQTARYQLAILLNQSSQFDSAADMLIPWASSAAAPLAQQALIALGMSVLRIPKLPSAMPAAQLPLLEQCGTIAEQLQGSHYDAAYAQLQALLQQYPHQPFLHFIYGKALAGLSHYDQATAAMQTETHISPRSELPWIWLSRIALQQGNASNALTPARRAVALAPDSAEAHYMQGRAELQLNQIAPALADLQMASRRMPNSPQVHFALAQAYVKAHQTDKAEQERTIFQNLRNASSGADTTPPQ